MATLPAGLWERVTDFIQAEAPGAGGITPDTPLMTSGLLDSVALIRLAALLERETGFTIPDRDVTAEHFDTVRLMQTYLAARTT